jgi:hypothetical protein
MRHGLPGVLSLFRDAGLTRCLIALFSAPVLAVRGSRSGSAPMVPKGAGLP